MEAIKKVRKEKQEKQELQVIWGLTRDEALTLINLVDKVLVACTSNEAKIKEIEKKIKKAQKSLESLKDMGLEDIEEEVKKKISEMQKEIEELEQKQKEDYPDGWSLPALKKFKKNLKEKFNL